MTTKPGKRTRFPPTSAIPAEVEAPPAPPVKMYLKFLKNN